MNTHGCFRISFFIFLVLQIGACTPSKPVEIIDENGIAMRLIPAGEFTMGSDLDPAQMPVHKVYLDAFYIDKYEVTNQAYQMCVDAGICKQQIYKSSATHKEYYENPEFSNFPVISINWETANSFCQWRGARLPTEAEWEKAARGTDARMYPWGNEFGCNYANMVIQGEPCIGDTTAVGSHEKDISPYGVYDMGGNVGEWTSSIMFPYPYDKDDGRENPNALFAHVVRGGSWYYLDETIARTTSRDALNSLTNDLDLGFRCANDVSK